MAKIRNYRSIVRTLEQEFDATMPSTNPYIIEVNLPAGMGLKRLNKFLQPVDGIEIQRFDGNRLWVAVDEFDAEVVPNTYATTAFSTQPFNTHTCIKVQSLIGELAAEEVHEVQQVSAKDFKPGDLVRVRIIYNHGTDYGRRCIVTRYPEGTEKPQ